MSVQVASTTGKDPQKPTRVFNFLPVAIAWGVMLAFYVSLRLYQQAFAFKFGLDSTSPDFEIYWKALFKIEVPAIFGIGAVIWAYLWFTRDRRINDISPGTELKRYFTLIGWFLVYTFSFLWVANFFGEGDATWHQTVIRDTALTPSHIVLFYACIPTYIVVGVGTLIYATTRIPAFAKSYSVPLLMVVVGPGLILPNLGYNEWGHAFWFTEETFSHPLHWGFPVLGWTALAIGGVLLQVMRRVSELFKVFTPAASLTAK